MKTDLRAANRPLPHRPQPIDHHLRITKPYYRTSRRPHCRQQPPFQQKQPPYQPRRISYRKQHPRLPASPLNSENKNQRYQHNCRDYQKHTKAQKQLTKIDSLIPCRIPPHSYRLKKQSRRSDINIFQYRRGNCFLRIFIYRKSHRRQVPKPVRPHLLPSRKCDKRLGRPFVLVPIVLIALPYFPKFDWNTRLPIPAIFNIRQTRKFRHQFRISRCPLHRQYPPHLETALANLKTPHRSDNIITKPDLITFARPKIIRKPLVYQYLVVTHISIDKITNTLRRFHRRDERVRHHLITMPKLIDKIS